MTKTIGILGCGWLGFPLAQKYTEDRYNVLGTTTSPKKMEVLKSEGITPFLITVSEDGIDGDIEGFLKDIDILVINIPPGLRRAPRENYVKKMSHLHKAIKKASGRSVIFISSSSVYGDNQGRVDEDTLPRPTSESGKQLLASEKIFREDPDLNAAIIRFGGLIGPDRHPINQLSGKKGLSNGRDSINLIHLNDCIGLITTIITNNHKNILINGVYPLHPTKKEYYTSEANKKGRIPPEYETTTELKGDKIVENTSKSVKIYQYNTSIIS